MDLLLQEEVTLVLVGTKEEGQTLDPLLSRFPKERVWNLMGRTSVIEMAALIQQASLFAGGDSGPGHLALALQTPTVRIFGPSDSLGYAAWGAGLSRDLTTKNSCRPSIASGVPRPETLGRDPNDHSACLHSLEPQVVFKACEELLSKT